MVSIIKPIYQEKKLDYYSFIKLTYPIRSVVRWLTSLILFIQKKKIILVFGLSRSGTTMLGQFLALGSSTAYIHEPEAEFLLKKYKLERSDTFDYRGFSMFTFEEGLKQFKIHCLICSILRSALSSERTTEVICIKPIYLTDVMEATSDALKSAQVLYISRHPCGRSESILRQRLHDQKIHPEATPESYLEMLGHSWAKQIHLAQMAFQAHPAWHWILFETLTQNPLMEFKELYKHLKLNWDEHVERRMQELTTGDDGGFYEIKRNSIAQAQKWRNALTANQIEAIRRGCSNYKTDLYESF